MPALRTLTPTSPSPRARVLLYAPALSDLHFKQRHVDGEALALHAHLRAAGHHSTLLDAYYRARRATALDDVITQQGPFDVLLVHLWTSDAYGPRLRSIADELAATRARHQIPVVGFGPLATSAATELRHHQAVDHTISLGQQPTAISNATVSAVMADAAAHLTGHTPLTALTDADVPYQPDAVVSVSASRGCRSRCTFCAYNADIGGGWTRLPMAAAVADIAHLHHLTGATRFAFADTDFGGTRAACAQRAAELLDELHQRGLAGRLRISLNIRSETLDPDILIVLAAAGVDVILIGAESLNPDTLHRLYGKRQDLDHLHQVVAAADTARITTVASYILWHPWQTLEGLRLELAAIERFGRHRIPQFMARSRLLVIPGTVTERHIRGAGLLDAAPFRRAFRFARPDVAGLYDALAAWFVQNVTPVLPRLSENRADDLKALAELKIAEWEWLTATLGVPTATPTGAAT
ncbi:B12-binding domain-containing radical SAM protein [Plantactinospora sp. CA-294935]|uniref:B12-binding domain-containing radical SAM protein n=1 Tax=Plantactinospora sp. CA-294935 TaxID=3240012 RepID=UPI003D8BFF1F